MSLRVRVVLMRMRMLVLTVADKILMFYHAGVVTWHKALVQTIASMLKWVADAQV